MKNQPLLYTLSICTLLETQKIALSLGSILKKNDVLALKGNLGAGKTTFARFLIQSLTSLQTPVPSPTFTLVQLYETSQSTLWHFDFYRLENPFEAFELGLEESFKTGICLLEWPEKVDPLLPSSLLVLEFINEEDRSLHVYGDLAWKDRLSPLFPPQP